MHLRLVKVQDEVQCQKDLSNSLLHQHRPRVEPFRGEHQARTTRSTTALRATYNWTDLKECGLRRFGKMRIGFPNRFNVRNRWTDWNPRAKEKGREGRSQLSQTWAFSGLERVRQGVRLNLGRQSRSCLLHQMWPRQGQKGPGWCRRTLQVALRSRSCLVRSRKVVPFE